MDFDDEVTFVGVGGHVMEEYKSYKAILQAFEKDEGSLVNVTVEYEKFKENDEPPKKYLNVLVHLVKDR